MKELQLFSNPDFGEIRTINEDGNVLFCGRDIAKALGYAKPQNAISAHCKGALKRGIGVQTGIKADGSPATQNVEMLFIHEGDIYRLAIKSELPSADKFESWIFDEVIPSIRKHGNYSATIPQNYPSALRALADEYEKNQSLANENTIQKQLIAEYEPKAQYVDKILSSHNTLTVTQIAADYDISAKELNSILYEEHVQRKVNDQWILYKEHMGLGYTKSSQITITRHNNKEDYKLLTKWTQKGRLFIHELLTKRGIVAIIDRA